MFHTDKWILFHYFSNCIFFWKFGLWRGRKPHVLFLSMVHPLNGVYRFVSSSLHTVSVARLHGCGPKCILERHDSHSVGKDRWNTNLPVVRAGNQKIIAGTSLEYMHYRLNIHTTLLRQYRYANELYIIHVSFKQLQPFVFKYGECCIWAYHTLQACTYIPYYLIDKDTPTEWINVSLKQLQPLFYFFSSIQYFLN